MLKFLQQPAYLPAQTGPEADAKYKRMRLQVFVGAFIGYAGFYLVRKNLSMAIPRALLELKECMMRIEIADLNAQLRNRPDNYAEIFQRLMECNEIKKQLDKDLGERIVTG